MRSYFIIVIGITVTLFMTMLFVTIQPAQAQLTVDVNSSFIEGVFTNEDDITLSEFTPDHAITINIGNISLINLANLTVNADFTHGIHTKFDNNKITNRGTITILGGDSGISAKGNNSILNNYGTIVTAQTGMLLNHATNTNGKMTNYGTITATTVPDYAIPMWLSMSNSTAINASSGTLTATGGMEALGMYSRGFPGFTNSITTNNGTIKVSGAKDFNIGIWVFSEDNTTHTINNSGSITATGNNAYAIKGEDGEETLNLFSGSDINGDINFGAGNDTLNAYGGTINGDVYMGDGDDTVYLSLNSILNGTLDMGTGNDIVNFDFDIDIDFGGRPQVAISYTIPVINGQINLTGAEGLLRSNKTLYTIDHTEQAVKSSVLSSLTSGLHRTIGQRLDTLDKKNVWFQGLYWSRHRGSENEYFGYDHKVKGGMGGVEGHIQNARFGAVAGIASGQVNSNPSFETESDSYFAGIYTQIVIDKITIRASFLTGYEDHDTERNILNLNQKGNIDNSNADFDSIFITPGIGIKANLEINKSFALIPSLDLSHSVGWYESYRYSGTENVNISVDDRTLQAFNGILKLKAVYENEWFAIGAHVGGTGRFTDDEDVDGTLGSSNYSYDIDNDDSVYGVIAGGYLNVAFNDNFHLNLNADHIESDGDESQNNFTFGLQYNF